MTLAAGSHDSPHQTADALIHAWGAYQLLLPSDPRPSHNAVSARMAILERVLNEHGTAGLFTCDPTKVALSFYGGRVASNRRQRTARKIASTLEDFREWNIRMKNRGG